MESRDEEQFTGLSFVQIQTVGASGTMQFRNSDQPPPVSVSVKISFWQVSALDKNITIHHSELPNELVALFPKTSVLISATVR